MAAFFNRKEFLKHQYIIQQGGPAPQCYFLIRGLVKSIQIDDVGKEHIIDFATENQWITDLSAFYNHTQATVNVYCIENCSVLAITRDHMEQLCSEVPKMQYYFWKKSVSDQALLSRRILCLIRNNATDRYHDLVTSNPEWIRRVPKTMIASYLGVSRETLSRMMLHRV